MSTRMPVMFVGHGSPMNAIDDNAFRRGFAALAERVPRPKAIVCVSAHWYTRGTFVTAEAKPKTIHDFGGFPRALYEVQYPAPGEPALAARLCEMLSSVKAQPRENWGLDHGTWSVLANTYPKADIPIVQLSVDSGIDGEAHVAIGKALSPLRDEGVLVMGSGNVVHNLQDAFTRMRSNNASTPDWAQRLDAHVEKALRARDTHALTHLLEESPDGRRGHPSPDHYFPLLYAYGASDAKDAVQFPIEGFDVGSISMRSVIFG